MRQRLALLFQVPSDLDYVESFQALSKVNLEIRRHGPSTQRLVRKAKFERDAGNHAAGLVSAQDALALDPRDPELHYQVGLAFLHLALAKADALPMGPSPTELPRETVSALLAKSVAAFRMALELNPRDEDARQDAVALQSILDAHGSDSKLGDHLRSSDV